MGVNESMHFELYVFGNFLTYLLFIVNYIDMKIFCTVSFIRACNMNSIVSLIRLIKFFQNLITI